MCIRDRNIAIDEQSGFMKGRRLQTRILGIVENLRLTVAACNRPALTIFVDFLSAFDRMWYPALIKNLHKLEMPIPLLKWIHSWLQNRHLYIVYRLETQILGLSKWTLERHKDLFLQQHFFDYMCIFSPPIS